MTQEGCQGGLPGNGCVRAEFQEGQGLTGLRDGKRTLLSREDMRKHHMPTATPHRHPQPCPQPPGPLAILHFCAEESQVQMMNPVGTWRPGAPRSRSSQDLSLQAQ